MKSSRRFVTLFLYALYHIFLVFHHLFFWNVRAANLLWPETSWSQPHRSTGRYPIAISWILFHLAFSIEVYNAANLFPLLVNHEAGKVIIFSLILQFIVCQKKKNLMIVYTFWFTERDTLAHARTINHFTYVGPVHTNAFSEVCVFIIIENESINSSPHYCFDAFLTVPRRGGGTWVFFGWVCAARDSKLAPRSKKKFP